MKIRYGFLTDDFEAETALNSAVGVLDDAGVVALVVPVESLEKERHRLHDTPAADLVGEDALAVLVPRDVGRRVRC
jgi:hypothetical protein